MRTAQKTVGAVKIYYTNEKTLLQVERSRRLGGNNNVRGSPCLCMVFGYITQPIELVGSEDYNMLVSRMVRKTGR
jgi:hypothetical protein